MSVQITSLALLMFLIVCAVCASLCKNTFHTILIYMTFGTVMSVIWLLLQAADLAITEAAVGVGVDAILYFLTLRKIGALKGKEEKANEADMAEDKKVG